jgi:hypothetical protein
MKRKRKIKNDQVTFWRVSSLTLMWAFAIFLLVFVAFNYGISSVSGRQAACNNLALKTEQSKFLPK